MAKRILLLLIALVLTLTLLTACKSNQEDAFGTVEGGNIGIKQEKDDPSADTDQNTADDKNNIGNDQKDEPAEEKDTPASGNDNPQPDPPKDESPSQKEPQKEPTKEESPKEPVEEEDSAPSDTEEEETPEEEPMTDVLFGKTALFVGDSICYGSRDTEKRGAWAGRIAEETGLIATNNGASGTSLSDVRKDRFGLVVDQLTKAKDQTFDYVVLHGGVNDAWDSVPVGVCSPYYDPSSFDCNTYAGGLERLIYTAVTLYGDHASIGYLINFKAPSCANGTISNMSEYATMAKKICEKWGIACFDMYNHQEITKALKFHTKTYTTDFIHPNSQGYDVLAPYIADFMRTMTPYEKKF